MNRIFYSITLLLLTITTLQSFANDPSPEEAVDQAYKHLENGAYNLFCSSISGYESLPSDIQHATEELLTKAFSTMGTFKLVGVEKAIYAPSGASATVNVTATLNGQESSDNINVLVDSLGIWKIDGKGIIY